MKFTKHHYQLDILMFHNINLQYYEGLTLNTIYA